MNIIGLSKRLFSSPKFSNHHSLQGIINNPLVETTMFSICNPIFRFSGRSFHHHHHLHKAGNFVVPRVFIVSRNLSTNASKQQPGFLRWYLIKLHSYPFVTKSITSSLIYMAADLTSQMITMPPSGSFDLMRTSRMATFGLLFLGPSQHLWFSYISFKHTTKARCLDNF